MKALPAEESGGSRPRAVIYLRTATREPGGETAISRQREACERKARELGADVAGVFADQGGSGRTLDRPGLRDLLFELAWHGHIQYVIAANYDRIGRDYLDVARVTAVIERAKAQLVSAADQAQTPKDRFMIGLFTLVDEFYRAQAADTRRVKS
jgi:DNA invertase Pin-like site-specific DNA recombinase